jgi:GNAT superfamily N-acetyltransferase
VHADHSAGWRRQTVRRASWLVTSGEPSPETVRRLLRALPDWFGIESSNAAYVQAARELPTYLAWPGSEPHAGQPVGVLLATRHFPQCGEIHLLAVDPDLHRRGIGRALVEALEADLVADGALLLEVKTLGPSHPDAGYAKTREFYLGMGFLPVQELHELWPGNPALIMVKPLVPGQARAEPAQHRPAQS